LPFKLIDKLQQCITHAHTVTIMINHTMAIFIYRCFIVCIKTYEHERNISAEVRFWPAFKWSICSYRIGGPFIQRCLRYDPILSKVGPWNNWSPMTMKVSHKHTDKHTLYHINKGDQVNRAITGPSTNPGTRVICLFYHTLNPTNFDIGTQL